MQSARLHQIFLFSLLTVLVWYGPNRPQAGNVTMPDARFESVSYAPFRAWQSPLTKDFSNSSQVAQDLHLIANSADGIRTYSSMEGNFDIGTLAKQAHLKVWEGIWLDANPRENAREMAAGIKEANEHPKTVTRVVVGNEVLLRRDLSVGNLIKDIDSVRKEVKQPVAYADVPKFWLEFPQVAKHVDIVMIHLLPYWQNHPVDVNAAIARIAQTIKEVKRRFPGKKISVGETGWPSRGRWRGDAAPSRVNEIVFLRKFVALADREHINYNLIEAFDQNWKYHDEGVAGANWGIWNAARVPKFPLHGAVVEMPRWRLYACAALVLGSGFVLVFGVSRLAAMALAFGLSNALVYATATTLHTLYDFSLLVCASVNLPAQALFACTALRRATIGRVRPPASGLDTITLMRSALSGQVRLRKFRQEAFDHLWFLFVSTASILQMMLVFDPRYRDAPFAVFAVPIFVAIWRLWTGDLPCVDSWRDVVPSFVLAGGALVSAIISGAGNSEFMIWNTLAIILAAPGLVGFLRRSGTRSIAGHC